jgi:hypothetical protein
MDNIYNLIFEALIAAVNGEGGDGWGFVVSKNYRKMADQFESWEILHGNYFTTRKDYDEFITFYNGEYSEDSVMFTSSRNNIQFPDIIIEY